MSWKYETGTSPSYSEIVDRFGEEISLDDALEKTAELQRDHPMVAIGSVLAHPDVYGGKKLRNTSRDLDFIAPESEIGNIIGEANETWSYGGAAVYVDEGERDWMIAILPMQENTFPDEKQGEFKFKYEDWRESRLLSTNAGTIEAVSPEIGQASKMRRYLMQKNNRGSFKTGDILDLSSMALRNTKEGLYSSEKMREYGKRYLNPTVKLETVKDDFREVLDDLGDSFSLNEDELREITNQVEEWYDNQFLRAEY